MAQPETYFFVAADLLPDFNIKLESVDEDGIVTGNIALSTFDSITLRLRREDGSLVTSGIVVDDDAAGEGHFAWADGDLAIGTHEAEILLVRVSDLKPETIPPDGPMIFKIRDPV